MGSPITCGNCSNGKFNKTPTGKVSKKASGRCARWHLMALEIKSRMSEAPCLTGSVFSVAIWWNTPATSCHSFSAGVPSDL